MCVCVCVQACMNSDTHVEGRDNLRCQSLLSTLYETGSLIIHHGICHASRPVRFWGFSAQKPWGCRCVLCVRSSAWFCGSKQVLTLETREPSHQPLKHGFYPLYTGKGSRKRKGNSLKHESMGKNTFNENKWEENQKGNNHIQFSKPASLCDTWDKGKEQTAIQKLEREAANIREISRPFSAHKQP